MKQPDKDLSRSEPVLALKDVEVSSQDVELLPQIINELEAEKAAMDQQVSRFFKIIYNMQIKAEVQLALNWFIYRSAENA